MLSRQEEFYQYGLEVRHLPLYKALQSSSRCVTTLGWMEAREELRFGRLFDRMVELRQAGRWSLVRPRRHVAPAPEGPWSRLMKEMSSSDVPIWSKWCRMVAKQLALEAAMWVATKRKMTMVCTVEAGSVREAKAQIPEDGVICYGWNLAIPAIEMKGDLEMIPALTSKRAWSVEEDRVLVQQVQTSGANWEWCAACLNVSLHGGRILRTSLDCRNRYSLALESMAFEAEGVKRMALFQEDLIALLLSQHTKIVTPKTAPTGRPRISLNSHPSHDQAARKATQSISKMLTPAELALRRLQKPPTATNPAASAAAAAMVSIGRPPPPVAAPAPQLPFVRPPPRPPSTSNGGGAPPMPKDHQVQQQQALLSRTQAMGSYLNLMANATAAVMNKPAPLPLAPQPQPAQQPVKRPLEEEEEEAEAPASSPVRQLRRPK